MSELNEMNCTRLAAVAAELALGVLTGRERAEAIAHLDECDACREDVRQLMLTGEELLGLLLASESPAGFETRVLERLGLPASGRGMTGSRGISGPRRLKALRGLAGTSGHAPPKDLGARKGLRGASAGHLPPALRHPDGTTEFLDVPGGVLLGAGPSRYPATDISLPPGSVLALYTDGLIEHPGQDISDGMARLARTLAASPAQPLDQLSDSVLASLGAYARDDIALLLARTTETAR